MRLRIITVPYRYDEPDKGVGRGPDAILAAGLPERLTEAGLELDGPVAARLDPADRESGRTAVNIGRLGAGTASLVAAARLDGIGSLVLTGDDTAIVGVISGLQQADGAGAAIGVVWLDAHGDFNTPETSFSGILAGMPLAILAGLGGPLWRGAAGLAAPVPTDRMLIAGVRELDEKEETLLRSTSVRVVTVAELRDGDAFAVGVARIAAACSVIALHVDLDVLDPPLVPSSSTPAANGLSVAEAAAALAAVLATGKVASLTVSSLNPGGGERGKRSIQSALAVVEGAVTAWDRTPAPPPS